MLTLFLTTLAAQNDLHSNDHAGWIWRERPSPVANVAPSSPGADSKPAPNTATDGPPAARPDRSWRGSPCVLNDVDGDGARDILLRGFQSDAGGTPAWVLSGRSGRILAHSAALEWSLGWNSTACGSDIDGDGYEDWISCDNSVGIVRSSRTGEALFDESSPWEASCIGTWTICGDFDGDGRTDFLVRGSRPSHDMLHVVSGRNGRSLFDFVDRNLLSPIQSDVCTIGDQDGDGRSDLAIAAWSSQARKYVVRVVSSATRTVVRRFEDVSGIQRGVHVRDAGDLNGDGVHDLLVGSEEVAVRLYSGCDGKLLFEVQRPPDSFNSCGCNDETGFGREMAGLVDREGNAFVLICLTGANVGVGQVEGWSVARRRRAWVACPPMADDDWYFGSTISWLGDVDGDGTSDFITCPDHMGCGNPARMYVCSGETGKILWSAVRTLSGIDIEPGP